MIINETQRSLPKVGLVQVSIECANDIAVIARDRFSPVKLAHPLEDVDRLRKDNIKLVLVQLDFEQLKDLSDHKSMLEMCKDISIPVIAIIRPDSIKFLASALYMGISDYVLNPIIKTELIGKINSQIVDAASQAIFSKESSIEEGDSIAVSRSGERILLVDDAVENVHALASMLRKYYLVDVVTRGEDAVNLVKKRKYDLVVLDIVIPDMSGFDVCRQIKSNADTESIPIIFFSGSEQSESEKKSFDLGAVDYIKKPVSFDALRMRIERHLSTQRKIATLYHFSYVDTLTGLPNRRSFEKRFEEEYRRAEREQNYISIIMVDVDQFKLFNDCYGHPAGDECLRKVAKAMDSMPKRSGDIVCRVGGEEFTILLPSTDIAGAEIYAKKLLRKVKAVEIAQAPEAQHEYITISAGVATCLAGSLKNIYELIFRADQRLYMAKHRGRDCCESVLLNPNAKRKEFIGDGDYAIGEDGS